MDVEISKSVLMDIAAGALEGIEGIEVSNAPLKVGEVLRQQGGPRRPRALKVTREGGQVTVDVGLNVEYGRNLVQLAQQAQRAVCENVELMTGGVARTSTRKVSETESPTKSTAVNSRVSGPTSSAAGAPSSSSASSRKRWRSGTCPSW